MIPRIGNLGALSRLEFRSSKMASLAAQLLDELMGRNRNALPTDRTKELSYNDAEVSGTNIIFIISGLSLLRGPITYTSSLAALTLGDL